MFIKAPQSRRRRTVAVTVAAVALALVSSSAMAYETSGDEDDASEEKKTACSAIGCEGGERKCGTISGKVSAGLPPFVGEVALAWTCYEKQRAF